jgi:hypothetical protein
MWIEGDLYSFAVVNRTDADAKLLASLAPLGTTVQVFDTKYSYSDLTAFTKRASDTLAKDGLQFSSIGPRPEIGKILITVPASNANVQNALASAIPEDSFVVVTSGERSVATDGE